MKIKFYLLLGALLLTIAIGCSSGPTTPEETNKLTGLVLDSQGNPVEGAGIVMNFALPQKNRPITEVQYSMSDSTFVTVFITSDCSEERVRTLVENVMPPGMHSIIWDSRDDDGLVVPSGFYTANVIMDGVTTTVETMLWHENYAPDANPADYLFQTETAADGTFALSQGCLPFGRSFDQLDYDGNIIHSYEVSREVRFFAMLRGYSVAGSDWTTADQNDGCAVEIQLVEYPK